MSESVEAKINAKWDAVAVNHAVHPEIRKTSLEFLKRGYKPEAALDLDGCRAQFHDILTYYGTYPFDGKVEDIVIPSPQVKSGIPARVYRPTVMDPNPTFLLYFHGGGLVAGSMEGYDGVVRRFANFSKAIMINVDYRLLPNEEDPYAPFNDCAEATRWVIKNKVSLGGQEKSKVGIIGDSAGGQICATVSLEVPGVAYQVLIYPVASYDFTTPMCVEFEDIPSMNTKALQCLFSRYLKYFPNAVKDPRFNPSLREDVSKSPPTIVVMAELDPLTEGGVAYARKLDKAGVPVEWVIINGFAHGFLLLPVDNPTGFEQGLVHCCRFAKSWDARL